jgi:hypothetical protein
MEFRGHLVKNLLRVLTPEEIAELTTSSSERKKVDLSLLLRSDLDGADYNEIMEKYQDKSSDDSPKESEEAKILPFDSSEEPVETIVYQAGERVLHLLSEYSKVFAELDKKVLGPKRFPKRKGSSGKKQTSALILEQKEKLHASYSKIKSMEVLSLYQDTKKNEVRKREKDAKEDFSFSSQLGVLINKKQA